MWSTTTSSKDVVAAYKEGAQSFVQKPSYYRDLVEEMKTILQQNGLESQ
jgi:DNA-binding response OmpR family regulator